MAIPVLIKFYQLLMINLYMNHLILVKKPQKSFLIFQRLSVECGMMFFLKLKQWAFSDILLRLLNDFYLTRKNE